MRTSTPLCIASFKIAGIVTKIKLMFVSLPVDQFIRWCTVFLWTWRSHFMGDVMPWWSYFLLRLLYWKRFLSAIANGDNTIPRLTQATGESGVTGHLKRLEEDYELITKQRPIFAKEGTQTVRMRLQICFCASGSAISPSTATWLRWETCRF